jgi:hypothetical protein
MLGDDPAAATPDAGPKRLVNKLVMWQNGRKACQLCVLLLLLLQAVVKEGGGPERLVVKLGIEKAAKGNPNFARRMLGLATAAEAAPQAAAAAAAGMRLGQGQQPEGVSLRLCSCVCCWGAFLQ